MKSAWHTKRLVVVCVAVAVIAIGGASYADEKEFVIKHHGQAQRLTYDVFVPDTEGNERMPVVVCVGGLPVIDGAYAQSSTQECMDTPWKRFAQKNRVVILGVGFLFVEHDWPTRTSYQYPQAWSGEALRAILNSLSQEIPIDPNEVYLFGISAGAQFAVRFAQAYPLSVRAVAAHAAGGYDAPTGYIPVTFLLTVGEFDNKNILRRDMAKTFASLSRKENIDVTVRVIGGIGHWQTPQQNALSRKFFAGALKKYAAQGQ